jgi:hypothetical protein
MTSRQLNFTLSAALLLGAIAFILHATFRSSEHLSSSQLIGEWENELPKFAKDQYSTKLSILRDGTFVKTEKKSGQFSNPRTTVFNGQYKLGSSELYGDYVQFIVFSASSPDDEDVPKKMRGQWRMELYVQVRAHIGWQAGIDGHFWEQIRSAKSVRRHFSIMGILHARKLTVTGPKKGDNRPMHANHNREVECLGNGQFLVAAGDCKRSAII